MELLAPAGGMEQLRYALHFGADAVYLAGDSFGMRARAENFPGVELASAVALAHSHGKRVYIAANTLVHQGDIGAFREHLALLEEIGADAAIVSDLAAIPILHEVAPHVDIHISTQASVVNAESARIYHELGAKRVVLARELSLAEITQIRDEAPRGLELEVFVHGAMCIAYSGRCLISSYLVGRDANRGNCTQPCRWKWSLQEETRPDEHFPIEEDGRHSFILSSADLNMLSHLDDLRDAGIDSLKIEGRVKGAYYVATVTNAYRQVLDGAHAEDFLPELETVSHRPYHTGFFYGTPSQSYEGHEYSQTCDLVGTVENCLPRADGGFDVTLMLRNRFYDQDLLEVLSPGFEIRTFAVADLEDEDGLPCAVANRNAHRYRFTCPFRLEKLDIIRKRRKDPLVQAGR